MTVSKQEKIFNNIIKLVGIGRLCSVPHHVFVIISHISKLFSAKIIKSFGNAITFQNYFIKNEKKNQ